MKFSWHITTVKSHCPNWSDDEPSEDLKVRKINTAHLVLLVLKDEKHTFTVRVLDKQSLRTAPLSCSTKDEVEFENII